MGTTMAMGHGRPTYAKNVLMKKKKIMIKRKAFVHYVKQKWV